MGGKVYKQYRVFGKSLKKISKQADEESKKREFKMKDLLLSPCE